ncbi:hypothetical protein HDU98_008820 [Podochytrium sp. JEL0797]|nr:hypothetical protein HDU98_008820 [Podochytrium sp. JEL0797]
MQFFVAALALIASVSAHISTAPASAATTVATGFGNTCTTSAGGSISIISPLRDSVNQATLNIAWNSNGIDPVFQGADLAFSLVISQEATNAQPISERTFVPATTPLVSAGMAVVAIPASVATGSNYALRSEYKDGTQWRHCFSAILTIYGVALFAPALLQRFLPLLLRP